MESWSRRWLSIALMFTLGARVVLGEAELAQFELRLFNDSKAPVAQEELAYGLPLRIGSAGDEVMVLPTFYLPQTKFMDVAKAHEPPTIYVPGLKVCEWITDDPKDWNIFTYPKTGQFISAKMPTDPEDHETGFTTIKWKSSNEPSTLKLMLRRGAGNVTVIDEVYNDGEYRWNVAKTFKERFLSNAGDYQLMLYTDNPPKSTMSPVFSIGVGHNSMYEADTSDPTERRCERYLDEHGGFYNETADTNYRPGDLIHTQVARENSTWHAFVVDIGTTTIEINQTDSSFGGGAFTSGLQLDDIPIAQVKNVSLGVGSMSLMDLQKRRNAKHFPSRDDSSAKTNVVGLFIGSPGHKGSVTLGGYDRNLVNFNESAQFNRVKDELYVELRSITVVPKGNQRRGSTSKESVVKYSSREAIQLDYGARGIRLPNPVLDDLLPQIGSPKYDQAVSAYVYPKGYQVDWDLVFEIYNGTKTVEISIPGSNLFIREVGDNNPLTDRIESAKTYLAIGETPNGDAAGAFLGRAFLRECYVVDDSNLERFHLSAVNLTSTESDPIIGSFELLNADPFVETKKGPNIGPIVGGVLGGVAVLVVLFSCLYFVMRRNGRRRLDYYPDGPNSMNGSHEGVMGGGGGKVQNLQALGQGEYKINIPEAAARRADGLDNGAFAGIKEVSGFPLPPNINHPPPSFRTHSPVVSVSSFGENRQTGNLSPSPYNYQRVRDLAEQPYGPPSPNTAAADRIFSLTNSPPQQRSARSPRSNESRNTPTPTESNNREGNSGGLARQASVARSVRPGQVTVSSSKQVVPRPRFNSDAGSHMTLPLQSPTLGHEIHHIRSASRDNSNLNKGYFQNTRARANSDSMGSRDSVVLPLPSGRMNPTQPQSQPGRNGSYVIHIPPRVPPPAATPQQLQNGGLRPRPQPRPQPRTSPSNSLDSERTSVYGLNNARDDGYVVQGQRPLNAQDKQPEFFESRSASSSESLSLGGLGVNSWHGHGESNRGSFDARSNVTGRADSETMGRASSHLGYP